MQRLQLSISHSALLQVLDGAAEGHDEMVNQWQETLQESIIPNQNKVNVNKHQNQIILFVTVVSLWTK